MEEALKNGWSHNSGPATVVSNAPHLKLEKA